MPSIPIPNFNNTLTLLTDKSTKILLTDAKGHAPSSERSKSEANVQSGLPLLCTGGSNTTPNDWVSSKADEVHSG